MPVGDCQRAFGEAARRDGILLVSTSIEGLTSAGHLGLPSTARRIRTQLAGIFAMLGGDPEDLAGGPHPLLRLDWYHEPTGTPIEIDELQHFTTDRLATLRRYPSGVPLGYEIAQYVDLSKCLCARADGYRAAKEARGFRRVGGRRAQRAYFDAVRDLALPVVGCAPVVRVPATDDDGAAAYERVRTRLRATLGLDKSG